MSSSDEKKWWKPVPPTLSYFCVLGKLSKGTTSPCRRQFEIRTAVGTIVFPKVIKSSEMEAYKVRELFILLGQCPQDPIMLKALQEKLLFLIPLFLLELSTLRPLKGIRGSISMCCLNLYKLQNVLTSWNQQLGREELFRNTLCSQHCGISLCGHTASKQVLKVMICMLGGTSTQSHGETSRRRYFLARDSKGEFTHEETGKGWGKGIYHPGDGGWHGSWAWVFLPQPQYVICVKNIMGQESGMW